MKPDKQHQDVINKKRVNQFISLIKKIPFNVWENIVRNEPEWVYLEPLYDNYGFGRFAVTLLIIGLNDYQLKGKAEQKYWSVIASHLKSFNIPESVDDLEKCLTFFYQKERLPKGKIKRLHCFLQSNLAKEIWKATPNKIERNFQQIWKQLASIMKQNKDAKTICFAMKCLGITLLISNYTNFDFTCISIPVDSRIEQFTKKTRLLHDISPKSIRSLWNTILYDLQHTNERLTMIHLDSLIWQIGTLDHDSIGEYFSEYQQEKIGEELNTFIHD
jgi:N-glycosylase/DNA lyase